MSRFHRPTCRVRRALLPRAAPIGAVPCGVRWAVVVTVLVGLGLAGVGCSVFDAPGDPSTPVATLPLEDCVLSSPEGGSQVDARCGTLEVFEDRQAGSGRKIALRVAVVPAVSRSPEPAALFLLAGGPGQAATEAFPPILFAFDRLHQDRDIVLVDQRGTGSSHPLACEADDEDEAPSDDEAVVRWATSCVQELEESADPRLYTTSIAMEDLEDVRSALGYASIDLYGGSYGTRAAMEYARRHPDRVRTMVLDSVVPPDLALGTTVARDAQHALDVYFDRCSTDPDCRAAFPDLRASFEALLGDLEEAREVPVDDPFSGEPTTVRLDHETVAGTLRFLSYAPETAALLPLLIDAAARDGDYGPLAANIRILHRESSEMIGMGMHFSVVCAEDVPYFDHEDVALHNADTYLADLLTDRLSEVCAVWPRGAVPDDFKEPLTVDVPVLILSGEVDPVTPPEYGESVARGLPDSLHLVAKGQGHGVIYRGCIPRIVRAFVESGTLQGLETACIEEMEAPPFFVNPSGPVPRPDDEDAGEETRGGRP